MRPSSVLARTAQAGLARRRAAALSSLASVSPMSSATSSSRAPMVMLQAVAPSSRAASTGVLPSGACGRRCMSSVAERATTVAMPALSPTMTNGKIAKWNKKEGDAVNSGDTLVSPRGRAGVVGWSNIHLLLLEIVNVRSNLLFIVTYASPLHVLGLPLRSARWRRTRPPLISRTRTT